MDQPDERMPSVLREQLIADAAAPHVRKRNTLRNKMRLWQAKAKQAESSQAGKVGRPHPRKPSMPPTPWDNKPDVAD